MKIENWKFYFGTLAALMVAMGTCQAADGDKTEQASPDEQKFEVQDKEPTQRNSRASAIYSLNGKPLDGDREVTFQEIRKTGKYWIGISMSSASPALRSQLGLKENQGLVVESVEKETPAAKAGIKRHDVLIEVDDKPITRNEQLVSVVQKSGKEKKDVVIRVLRGGKKQVVKVMPTERSKVSNHFERSFLLRRDGDEIRKWLGNREHFGGDDMPAEVRLRMLHPGILLGRQEKIELPKNLKLSIKKEDDQPAKITVEQDGKKWETTEDKLEELPENVRPHVERMLGSRLQNNWPRAYHDWWKHVDDEAQKDRVRKNYREAQEALKRAQRHTILLPDVTRDRPASDVRADRLEKRLNATNEQLELLRKAVEALTKKLSDEK